MTRPEPPPRPCLVVTTGEARPDELPLEIGRSLVLGRSSTADMVLACEQVSRRHARLRFDEEGLEVEDLGSTSGTRVNGRVVPRKRLADGDVIELGTVSLTVRGLDEGPGASPVQARLLAALTDLLAGDGADAGDRLGSMLEGLTAALEADRGRVFLPDGAGGYRVAEQHVGPGAGLDANTPVSRQLVARMAREGRPQLLTTDATDQLRETFRSMPRILRSVLAAPLPLPGGDGVLYLDSVLERRAFAARDQELLVAFARAAGVCLARDEERRRERRLHRHLSELRRRELEAHRMVGSSPAMERLREEVEQAAGSDVTVLVTGESGTGKELVARALHRRSNRAAGPFVAVSGAAIPRDLVESELFGHEKGAFSGADARRLGQFELADGGTLFLDEVGELPLEIQGKLLRALQERTLRRLGGCEDVPLDFRLVAATNADLEAAVREGRFREDLFYRLAVFRIRTPPLRDRGEDVLELAELFRERFARELGRAVSGIAPGARELLCGHAWPGNIRELRNSIEQAVVRSRGPAITGQALAPALGATPAAEAGAERPIEPAPTTAQGRPDAAEGWFEGLPVRLDEARRDFERRFLERTLAARGGNMKATAKEVGLSRRGLYDKCAELGVDYRSFR